ncbi:MAG: exopolysaccharide biosynthesis polyprenyl glycosylphosphotransferase [Terriglobia bacterium]|jgi:exopolysaccharide biosynthesis polyprenyl glycosylphosphotransferase
MPLRTLHNQQNLETLASSLPQAGPVGVDDSIPGEKPFGELLCLERRRAERSRKPFLLMLLDLRKVMVNGNTGRVIGDVWASVCSSSRDSDIRGWYLQGSILGVIFVEVRQEGPISVSDIIHAKVISALSKRLEADEINRIDIRMYLQPDSASNWENWSGLYRDLREKESGRKLHRAVKRGLDIIGSATALCVLSPLMALIALLIKVTSDGPILFRQSRVGYRGAAFTFLKFRTMRPSNDGSVHKEFIQRFIAGEMKSAEPAPVYKIRADPRITRIGKFLRKTSLDELPQFWNVLIGEMSLVGPRPPIPYEVEYYDIWHRRRVLEVKPGLTGLWQVKGRSRTTFNDMVRLDLQYAKSWSIWLDLKILFETPLAMISGDGAY